MLIKSTDLKQNHIFVGGKANSLIKLVKMGMPVPEFFVVPKKYFEHFVKINKINTLLNSLLSDKKFKEAKKLIMSCDFDVQTKKEIINTANELNFKIVSVRSSVDNEDGKEKSFAGQYETYLNVKSEQILNAIKKCWVSALADNVISYSGDIRGVFSVNVIVQKMINPRFAGVAFSVDPISKSKNYSVIESCRGTGEKLVSGTTTPTKYMVRRETKNADLIVGQTMLNKQQVLMLEQYILEIEKQYRCPMDIEWCFSKQFYILQARPITAMKPNAEPILLLLTREKKLFELEILFKGEYFGIKNLTHNLYYFNPIMEYSNSGEAKIYYNINAIEETPWNMFNVLENDYQLLVKTYEKVKKGCRYVEEVVNGKKPFVFKKFVKQLLMLQPFSSLGNSAGQDWQITERVKNLLFEYRENYDKILYIALDFLSEKIDELLPRNLLAFKDVMFLDEIENPSSANITSLKKRKKGFVYFYGKIFEQSMPIFCSQNDFLVKTFGNANLKGYVACGGIVEAKVKIILNSKEFNKFEKGDILVTSMTTPKFTSIMQKASGIITDEGGLTCHAAIVARELKVPCVVGCKNATKLLKDNMKVKLDAVNGTIEVME